MIALLDANLFVPTWIIDPLLSLAEAGLCEPAWSARVMDEARLAIMEVRHVPDVRARGFLDAICRAFPMAMAEDWERFEPDVNLSDPNDGHVVAAADEFERVPLGRIVAGGDRDRAGRAGAGHGELDGRSRHHAEFHDLTARRKESGDQRVLEHGAGRAGIPPDHDAAAALIETECGAEFGHQPGGQPLADDAAHAAFRKLQCIDPAQGSLRSFR